MSTETNTTGSTPPSVETYLNPKPFGPGFILPLASAKRDRKFPCPVDGCPKSYSRPSLLTEHLRSHNNTRPFACDKCDKRFLRESHLKSHYWTHAEEKPLGCTQCDKRFITNQQLQRHEKVHEKKRAKEALKATEGSSYNYTWTVKKGELVKAYASNTMPTPATWCNSSNSVSTASNSPLDTISSAGTSISAGVVSDHPVFECPYGCKSDLGSTKGISDHILEAHVFSDTIDMDSHLASIKNDLDHAKINAQIEELSQWDGADWSDMGCKEVECQVGCPGFSDVGSLIAHYNDFHGFVPDSLFEFAS